VPQLGDCSFRHEADDSSMTVDLDTAPLCGEEELVLEWRFEELYRAGFPDHLALELATAKEVDLHLAVELIAHGCPPPTAARILL
jgi:hypothetical protein